MCNIATRYGLCGGGAQGTCAAGCAKYMLDAFGMARGMNSRCQGLVYSEVPDVYSIGHVCNAKIHMFACRGARIARQGSMKCAPGYTPGAGAGSTPEFQWNILLRMGKRQRRGTGYAGVRGGYGVHRGTRPVPYRKNTPSGRFRIAFSTHL